MLYRDTESVNTVQCERRTEVRDSAANGHSINRSVLTPQSSLLSTQSSGPTPERFCIQIAGITVALVGESPELTLGIDETMSRFVVEETAPDVQVRAAWGDLHDYTGGKKLFDSGSVWQLYAENGSYQFRFASPACGSVPYKVASLNRDFTAGEVYLHRPYFAPRHPVYPLEYPLDELLMTNLLARGRGVEVHACGAVDADGRGHLFLGQSGAGKSTMARIWQKTGAAQIPSDDRIILRERGNRLWMYGTPWHGEAALGGPSCAPVAGLFFLGHGQRNELVPLRPAEAVARLFACSFPPFYSPEALDFTLRFLEQTAQSVPCYDLAFLPDERVVEFISGLRNKD